MRTLSWMTAAALAAMAAAPAAAQSARYPGRDRAAFTVEPYAAYGFYGTLPDGGPRLGDDAAYGVKGNLLLAPRLSVTGSFQQSNPRVDGGDRARVQHWSTGLQLDFAPRQGAEGIPPVSLEAGVGQVRYDFPGPAGFGRFRQDDLAANLGIGSGIRLSRGLAVAFGVNDYVSNYGGDRGITHQVFARVGAQLRF